MCRIPFGTGARKCPNKTRLRVLAFEFRRGNMTLRHASHHPGWTRREAISTCRERRPAPLVLRVDSRLDNNVLACAVVRGTGINKWLELAGIVQQPRRVVTQ